MKFLKSSPHLSRLSPERDWGVSSLPRNSTWLILAANCKWQFASYTYFNHILEELNFAELATKNCFYFRCWWQRIVFSGFTTDVTSKFCYVTELPFQKFPERLVWSSTKNNLARLLSPEKSILFLLWISTFQVLIN